MKTFAQPQVEGLRKIFQAHGVPSGGRILDLACGLGRIAINLAKAGYDVVGVDISPLYLRLAQKWAKKESVDGKTIFYRIDARKATRLLASEEDRFDAVVNIGSPRWDITARLMTDESSTHYALSPVDMEF